ncbi:hypothetical protein SKAU_G00313650 [Synaphobranchus kaupii]|uniref:Uncharacterized protein n=1 Tax=Synaphobranchus kaupii TaxID=118154 RepID=A0A9Q1IKJ3_SYNKA|nr:hypothetical protein SKAU_G00313650 [Synaphobranchus kaupii]
MKSPAVSGHLCCRSFSSPTDTKQNLAAVPYEALEKHRAEQSQETGRINNSKDRSHKVTMPWHFSSDAKAGTGKNNSVGTGLGLNEDLIQLHCLHSQAWPTVPNPQWGVAVWKVEAGRPSWL